MKHLIIFILIAIISIQCTVKQKERKQNSSIIDTVQQTNNTANETYMLKNKSDESGIVRPKTAIIRYKNGYTLRKSPDNNKLGSIHLMLGETLNITDSVCNDTVENVAGKWYKTLIFNKAGYIFSDAILFYNENEDIPEEIAKNRLLMKNFPQLHVAGNFNEMKVKLKSGKYIVIDKGMDCNTMFADYISQLNSYLFASVCYGEDAIYFFIDYRTGKRSTFKGMPQFNNLANFFFVREYEVYEGERNFISLYKVENKEFKKVFASKLKEEHVKAMWENERTVKIRDSRNDSVRTIMKNNGNWTVSLAIKISK